MRICDICGSEHVRYNHYATIDEVGNGKNLELCHNCYMKFYDKERHHRYLAYLEVVEEIKGKSSQKKRRWLNLFRTKEN